MPDNDLQKDPAVEEMEKSKGMIFKSKYAYGDRVRDIISGFEGIITGMIDHCTGCRQYGVSPRCKDNKFEPSHWFDESRIELIQADAVAIPKAPASQPGGEVSLAPDPAR